MKSNRFPIIKVTFQKTVSAVASVGKNTAKRRSTLSCGATLAARFTTAPVSMKTTEGSVVTLCTGSIVAWEGMFEVRGWPADGRIKLDDFKVGMTLPCEPWRLNMNVTIVLSLCPLPRIGQTLFSFCFSHIKSHKVIPGLSMIHSRLFRW